MADGLCLLVQPIHAAGRARLTAAGLEVRLASAPGMEQIAREIGDAVAVVTRNAGLSGRAIAAAPRLRVIGNHGMGLDRIDLAAAAAAGIAVVRTPGANAVSTAEQAIALMLAVAKQVPRFDRAARRGDFTLRERLPPLELRGKTFAVLGYGTVGQIAAGIAADGFAMRVLHLAPRSRIPPRSFEIAPDLPSLLAAADVLSLHLPHRADSERLLDTAALAYMKPGAILVNTGRAATVDKAALVAALSQGRLAGAGLDVFDAEPLDPADPLAALPNVVLSPHVGGATEECLRRVALSVAEQVIDVLEGRPPAHPVELQRG